MLVPPEHAEIVFAHTPTGHVPKAYWWIDGRFAGPTEASFLLVPALRVVYVPVGRTFVAYDVGIAKKAIALTPDQFLYRTGRAATKSERSELAARLPVVLKARSDVRKLLRLGKHYEALDRMRAMDPTAFKQGRSKAKEEHGALSVYDRIARVLRLQDYVDCIVIGVALAILSSSGITALGLVSRLVHCVAGSVYGTRTLMTSVVSAAIKYGSALVGQFYPSIAEVMVHNRMLGCALSIALSVLSVSTSVLGDYAPRVSSVTVETTIACIGDVAETLRMRRTGEIIASVALIIANLCDRNNTEAVAISADAFERLVVAKFGTCLVPKTMLSVLVAIARNDLGSFFASYVQSMKLMGSITHRFALCLILPPSFGKRKIRRKKNEKKSSCGSGNKESSEKKKGTLR